MEVNGLSNANASIKLSKINFGDSPENEDKKVDLETKKDVAEIKSKPKKTPEISTARAFLKFLTDKQIKELNESKRLPSNCKFVTNGLGGFIITPNILGVRTGTRTLPDDYEVKRNILGFAIVVPKDSEGLFVR